MDVDRLTSEYSARATVCAELGLVVEHLLRELIVIAGVRVHSINHQVKEAESFARKIQRDSGAYDAIDDVHDILGVRVITYFPDEVDEIAKVVEQQFAVDSENSIDKRASLASDRFGYLSVHYVVSLNEARASLDEYSRFAGIKCEVAVGRSSSTPGPRSSTT